MKNDAEAYSLFLDDIRLIRDIYHHPTFLSWAPEVRHYDAFVAIITERGLPEYVSFDHDLADIHYKNLINGISNENCVEKTGYDCAKWLCDYCVERGLPFPDYAVHSFNPIGAENIRCYIENFKKSQSAA